MITRSQRSLLKILFFLAPLFVGYSANALLEVSVGGAGILSSSGGGNWILPSATFSGAYGLVADARFNLPTSSWGLGLRYQQLALTGSASGQTLAMNNTSTSLLVAYRIIDTGILFGPVVTYSLANTGTLQNSAASTGATTATASNVTQYTAGLELGIKFPFLLAVELGLGNLSMTGFSSAQTLAGTATNVALNGTYGRVAVGFSF